MSFFMLGETEAQRDLNDSPDVFQQVAKARVSQPRESPSTSAFLTTKLHCPWEGVADLHAVFVERTELNQTGPSLGGDMA